MPYYACVPRQSRQTSSFPRHPFVNDLAPLFRLFDDAASEVFGAASTPAIRTFQPRFDVREEKDAFHLTGELPGISQENINIEFVDQNTLTIHGKAVSERTSGTPPATVEGNTTSVPEKQLESAPAAETEKADASSSHQPSVEDDVDEDDYSTVSRPSSATATPASTVAETAKPTESAEKTAPAKKEQKSKYWISERSVGQFHRSFHFPGQVNQEAVTASLKDGILNVVVPKAVLKEPRKITVN